MPSTEPVPPIRHINAGRRMAAIVMPVVIVAALIGTAMVAVVRHRGGISNVFSPPPTTIGELAQKKAHTNTRYEIGVNHIYHYLDGKWGVPPGTQLNALGTYPATKYVTAAVVYYNQNRGGLQVDLPPILKGQSDAVTQLKEGNPEFNQVPYYEVLHHDGGGAYAWSETQDIAVTVMPASGFTLADYTVDQYVIRALGRTVYIDPRNIRVRGTGLQRKLYVLPFTLFAPQPDKLHTAQFTPRSDGVTILCVPSGQQNEAMPIDAVPQELAPVDVVLHHKLC